jgi:hypothetical protein
MRMTWLIGRVGVMVALLLGISAHAAQAQDRQGAAGPEPRWTLEGAAGFQTYYDGTAQSVAFGFSPNRSLTVIVSGERSHVQDRVALYEDGYSAERGGTEQFVSGGVRYAFFARKRFAPYLVGGIGRGTSRPNVNDTFPDRKVRNIHVLFYGGGVRIPIGQRFDALVDARLMMAAEAKSDYFGVRMPVRAGIAWRF